MEVGSVYGWLQKQNVAIVSQGDAYSHSWFFVLLLDDNPVPKYAQLYI
jgi:hypothetical protein